LLFSYIAIILVTILLLFSFLDREMLDFSRF